MKRFWKKQLPAALLALVMVVGMMPVAMATQDPSTCSHQNKTSTETAATCTTEGLISHSCSDCSSTWTEKNGTALGHDWSVWTIDASDSSKHSRSCNRGCGATNSSSHDFSGAYGKDGTQHWLTCKDCSAEGTRGDHSYTWKSNTAQHWEECICGSTKSAGAHLDSDSNDLCDTCSASVHVTHDYATTWAYDANQHWHPCTKSGCTVKSGAVNHYDGNSDGRCDTCNYAVGTYYTVTFQYLTTSGSATTSQQSVLSGRYPSNPSYDSIITIGEKLYQFQGWTTTYSGSSWYLYSNQTLVTPTALAITRNTAYYAVYKEIVSSIVTYTVAPGEKEPFDAEDFNKVYQAVNNTSRDISWVEFTVSSSAYSSFDGSVYLNDTDLSRSQLNSSTFYYDNSSDGDYDLDKLYLGAPSGADEESLNISFVAYRTASDYVSGTLTLVIDDDAAKDTTVITYEVTPGKTVDFDRADFNKVFQSVYSNYTVSYVVFDQPSSSAFSEGTLYCDYGTSAQDSFTRSSLDDAVFYHNASYATDDNEYDLDELTFAADSDFEDTVTLTFTAYGTGTRKVTGTVEIVSSEKASSDDEITYTVTPGKTVAFDRSDFNALYRKEYRSGTVSYVVFERPDSSAFADGTIYSDYDGRNEVSFTRNTFSSARFYYDEDDISKDTDYDLDDLTFVADSDFEETVKLAFAAYDTDGDYVEGTLVIKADGTVAPVSSNYVGNIRYAVAAGTNVQINANDIARFYSAVYPTDKLQYVVISGVPSTGALFYNYYGASSYGTNTRAQLTVSNCSGQGFYLSPSNTSQFALTELTYVPSGYNYCAAVPFTAYGSNASRSVSGAILISVSRAAVSEVYGVTPRNTAVNFPASSIYNAVFNATSSALHSIQLLSLPAANVGTVYVGGTTAVKANTTSQYTYASGTNSISQLRFVPATGYTGSVSIPYVALNSNGVALASGVFSLGVVGTRKTFTDISSSTWCYKYVTELSDANVIDGYANGSFKPDSTISYGAALKLIMLAAGYPEQAPTGSNVFSGYLAKAQADGLITRSNVNLSGPITRLQVAQLAAAALKLDTTNLSSVQPFTDTTDPLVRALNAAGIIEGYFNNGTYAYRPGNTLTRGQVSAIVWRMYNYKK